MFYLSFCLKNFGYFVGDKNKFCERQNRLENIKIAE